MIQRTGAHLYVAAVIGEFNSIAQKGETGIVIAELDLALRRLRSWSRPRRVRTPLAQFPARCFVSPEPYGVALIVGPWNFPVQLLLAPLVAALAAGNCALLKPSIAAPATSRLLARIIEDRFDPGLVSLLEGGAETAQALFAEKFDYLFFTRRRRHGQDRHGGRCPHPRAGDARAGREESLHRG